MSQTEITGVTYTVVHGTFALEGILDVKLTQTGGPEVEQLDVTVFGDDHYEFIPHPLGAKGAPKVKLTVVVQSSWNSFNDLQATAIPFNTDALTTWCMQPGTANTNTFVDTMQLTERTTEIPFAALATTTLVFEANGTGAWSSPA